VLGRGPEADVRINSTRVSRKHARIVVDGERVTVEDLGSKNGTFVGDVQVNGSSPLAHGDELRIGHLAAILRVVMADDDSTMTELSRESPPSQPSGLRKKN
jgi:pSer/pThr/pTyr-binding forkhead associated (FHA) protein